MEWKRVKMDPAELERKAQFYRQEAIGMMKKAAFPPKAAQAADTHEPEKAEEVPSVAAAAKKDDAAAASTETDYAETGFEESSDKLSAEQPNEPENVQHYEQEFQFADIGEACDLKDKPDIKKEFGVYTPEEIMAARNGSAGMKEAARLLDEMAQSEDTSKKDKGSFQKQKQGKREKSGG